MAGDCQAPTLGTLAAHLGVSRMTVSLALRGDPRIRESTRARVVKAAEEFHYRPAPLAAAWMRKVREGGNRLGPPTLAFLLGYTEPGFRENPYLQDIWNGARAAARRNGFKIRLLLREEGPDSLRILRQALADLGPSGVVIGLHGAQFRELDLPWETCAWVAMTRTTVHPEFHSVGDDSTVSTRDCFARLVGYGYRRPGFAVFLKHERVHSYLATAAFLAFQQQLRSRDRVPVLRLNEPFCAEVVRRWITRYQPDVLVSPNALSEPLRQMGYRIPEDLGFCGLGINVHHPEMVGVSGLVSPMGKIGQRSVDFLVSLIYRLELGIPERPYALTVVPEFRRGETLKSNE